MKIREGRLKEKRKERRRNENMKGKAGKESKE